MPRPFKIGVALVTLIAVAVIFIAPTIDLPETVLREHQAASHHTGGHSLDKFGAVAALDATSAVEEWAIPRGVIRLRIPPHIQPKSLLAMRG